MVGYFTAVEPPLRSYDYLPFIFAQPSRPPAESTIWNYVVLAMSHQSQVFVEIREIMAHIMARVGWFEVLLGPSVVITPNEHRYILTE